MLFLLVSLYNTMTHTFEKKCWCLKIWFPLYPSLLNLRCLIKPCLLSPHRNQILSWTPIPDDRHWFPEAHLHMKECSVHSALQIAFPLACVVIWLFPVGTTMPRWTSDYFSMFTGKVLELLIFFPEGQGHQMLTWDFTYNSQLSSGF